MTSTRSRPRSDRRWRRTLTPAVPGPARARVNSRISTGSTSGVSRTSQTTPASDHGQQVADRDDGVLEQQAADGVDGRADERRRGDGRHDGDGRRPEALDGAGVGTQPAGDVADHDQRQRPAAGDVVGRRGQVEQQAGDEAEHGGLLGSAHQRGRDHDEQAEVRHHALRDEVGDERRERWSPGARAPATRRLAVTSAADRVRSSPGISAASRRPRRRSGPTWCPRAPPHRPRRGLRSRRRARSRPAARSVAGC